MQVLDSFVLWSEKESASTAGAWDYCLTIFHRFDELRDRGNRYAQGFHDAFCERVNDTAEMDQLILGHVITPNGLASYKSLPESDRMTSRTFVDRQIAPLLKQFCRLLGAPSEAKAFKLTFKHILSSVDFASDSLPNRNTALSDFWTRMIGGTWVMKGTRYSYRLVRLIALCGSSDQSY
jgi:hypothetical protein